MAVEWALLQIFTIFIFPLVLHADSRPEAIEEDILQPYHTWPKPAYGHHRTIRSILSHYYNALPHENYPSPFTSLRYPLLHTYPFVETLGTYWNERKVTGHYFVVPHPSESLTVLEPEDVGGCARNVRSTVQDTAVKQRCLLATNAGFFNTTTGACIGNVVSNGRWGHSGQGAQNVHFGIKRDGNLFFGYLPEDLDIAAEFQQLVSGVIWMVRDGRNFVDISQKLENSAAQETGSLDYFVHVNSARMVVGNDRQGRVVMVHIDGKTGSRGINLPEFADLLISWGIVNAINLDGGGSVSVVVNGTYVNYPSDQIKRNGSHPSPYCIYRKVSTVLCVREPLCVPSDCHGHGKCVLGRCRCHDNWVGAQCNRLECGHLNCSGHGQCTAAGCRCGSGWYGESCEHLCPSGSFGLNCTAMCQCGKNGHCNPTNGRCHCQPGYTGLGCDQECPPGTFGPDCRLLCFCDNSCTCHHVTGACNVSMRSSKYAQVGYCLASQMINHRHLVTDQSDQFRMWLTAVIVLSLVASISLIVNISLLCLTYFHDCDSPKHLPTRRKRRTYRAAIFDQSSSDEDFSPDKEAIPMQEKVKPNSRMVAANSVVPAGFGHSSPR